MFGVTALVTCVPFKYVMNDPVVLVTARWYQVFADGELAIA
jgi:hypothetical protein